MTFENFFLNSPQLKKRRIMIANASFHHQRAAMATPGLGAMAAEEPRDEEKAKYDEIE